MIFCGMVMPADDDYPRYVVGRSTTSTLDFCAVMAMASRVFRIYDPSYACDDVRNGVVYSDLNPAACYVDVLESYASNKVAINWNAAVVLFLACTAVH